MIADSIRTNAYRRALQSVVTRDSVVADIGAGPGIFTLLSCNLGARRVYAIEPNDVIQIAAELAAAHDYANRVRIIQDLSTRTELPELADILVSDIRGVLPWFSGHIPSIIDARDRLLRPTGILIPQADIVSIAVVESEAIYTRRTSPWHADSLGVDLSPLNARLKHAWSRVSVAATELITPAAVLSVLDYRTIDKANVDERVVLRPHRAGVGHGLLMWFDTCLTGDIGYSNAPGAPELIYGQAFFPWDHRVTLSPNDEVHARIRARLIGQDYVWIWDTRVAGAGASDNFRESFSQSSFQAEVYSPTQLGKMHQDFLPNLNLDGKLCLSALQMMNAGVRLLDIARHILTEYPMRFTDLRSALGYVADLSKTYSGPGQSGPV
jgi:precorrin-6B methylase 2